jgi:hypothetical protein
MSIRPVGDQKVAVTNMQLTCITLTYASKVFTKAAPCRFVTQFPQYAAQIPSPMQMLQPITDNPFAVLSFLAAPAILTNASTLLALGTSNRLARAADRARAASAIILGLKDTEDPIAVLHHKDFQLATRRASMLVRALRFFYFSAGSFAAGTCVALVGAFSNHLHLKGVDTASQFLTMLIAVAGMIALVAGAGQLVAETRIALRALDEHHTAITRWRATHMAPDVSPTI